MRQDQSLQTHQQKNATRLLTYVDLCELLNRDRRTIWSWCKKGIFPSPIKSPAGVLMTFNHGWMGVTSMPNATQPPLKPMRSHRAKQALSRIVLKIQFLELANRILRGAQS